MLRAQPRRAPSAGWSSGAHVARPGISVEEESSTRSVEVLTQPGDFSMSLFKFLVLRIMTWFPGRYRSVET